jgi:hypothetical protein
LRYVKACRRLADDSCSEERLGSGRKPVGAGAIQIEIDGAFYTERDYADAASASHAIAQILRQRAERSMDLDEELCRECEEPLEIMTCSQCGADAFVRTSEDGGLRSIRRVEGAAYCCGCRP